MQTRNRAQHAPRRGIGFTLIELIVAIGAMALIAVGIASIFEAVGRTVSGGRRVSNLNQYAALIERQMRDDFQAMTRDGVLLIRNQFVDVDLDGQIDPQDGVPLHADEDPAAQRLRRVDQLIFFRRGDFSSARSPLIPGVNATSKEAMIHYGHGMRLHPIDDYSTAPAFERPQVDDGRFPPSGTASPYRQDLGLGVPDGPNRYAADWTLARWVRLLVPPASSSQNMPQDPVWTDLGLDQTDAIDNEIQVGGQPAAASAFSTLAAQFPSTFPTAFVRKAAGDGARHPTFASGVVDIVTTDLAEIRRIIMDAGGYPWDVAVETDLFDPDPANTANSLLNDVYDHTGLDLPFIQAWMDDLFPTNPHPSRALNPKQTGIRPRYEPALPDFMGTLSNPGDDKVFEKNLRLADQQILGSSVFVPRCTEFIVEYSFGQIVDEADNPTHAGQLIWFGLNRELAFDGQPAFYVVRPYPFDTTSNKDIPYLMPYTKLDGTAATQELQPLTLYGVPSGDPLGPLTAHFGYTDPTYLPTSPLVDPPTVPWAWPKLIRITLSLADPSDPSIEQTFQFIFETPEADAY